MGHLVGNQGMSYTISNLTKVAIWSLKSFRIHPHLAEKSTTLLFHGTFGHTVGCVNFLLCSIWIEPSKIATSYSQSLNEFEEKSAGPVLN